MKKLSICILLLIISEFIYGQTPTLIFTIEQGIDNEIVAVPFVMFKYGRYEDIPRCEEGSEESDNVKWCKMAAETILPIVSSGKQLYILNNGIQTGTIKIQNFTQYGFTDGQTYSALISTNPNVKLLTNNPLVGKKTLIEIKTTPRLEKRKRDEIRGGGFYEDKLLGKIDIDGDNIAELIYLSEDYEGIYFQIFSFKNTVWLKVFEGGGQGA